MAQPRVLMGGLVGLLIGGLLMGSAAHELEGLDTGHALSEPSFSEPALSEAARPHFSPWRDYHVVHYPANASLAQFKQDLPHLQSLLNLSHVRLALPEEQTLPGSLPNLLTAIQAAGFKAEVLMSSQEADSETEAILRHPALAAVLLYLPTAAQRPGFERLLTRLQHHPQLKQGLWFQRFADLKPHQDWLAARGLAAPDFYGYQYRGPLHDLHAHVRRGTVHLQKPWQLAQLSVTDPFPLHNQEHEMAWWYRFAFYFSKKYALLPAAAHIYPVTTQDTPGLLRSASPVERRTPAYWLTHVYFHLNRIDLDEMKLTRALYTPPGTQRLNRAERQHFLDVYYKLNPAEHLPDFIPRRRSPLFYDYVKREAEESLLNSHFARLQAIDTSPALQLTFLSALGRFHFLQGLRYGNSAPFPILGLTAPALASDFASYTKQPTHELPALAQLPTHFVRGETRVDLQMHLLKPLPSSATASEASSGQSQVFIKMRASGLPAEGLDLQPLALVAEDTGHVFIPEPLFFQFFKRLQGQESLQTLIPIPQEDNAENAPSQHFALRMDLEPARKKSPRRLWTSLTPPTASGTFWLELQNPFVERLFLPGLVLIAEQKDKVFVLDTVLPESLMPLEQRRYALQLPSAFDTQQPTHWHVKAAAYPVIHKNINLDDAFRTDVLGLSAQALTKYEEVLSRFSKELPPAQRQSVAERLISLSAGVSFQALEARLTWLLQYPLHTPALRLALVRSALRYPHPPWAALREHLAQAFARQDWQPELKDYELWAYVEKEAGNGAAAIQRYTQSLALALAQQSTADINRLYPLLVSLYQEQKAFSQGLQMMQQWQGHRAYQQLPLALRQRHERQLMYLAQQAGDLKLALYYGERALKQHRDPGLMLTVAGLYRQQGRLTEAMTWYRRLLDCAACPEAIPALKELAGFYQGRQPQLAASYYAQYLARARLSVAERVALEQNLLELWLRSKNWRAAQPLVQRLVKACVPGQHCAGLWERQGTIYTALRQPAVALQAYEKALQHYFSSSRLRQVAYLALEQKRWDLASVRFQQLLARDPQAVSVRLKLAHIQAQQGHFQRVQKTLAPFLAGDLQVRQREDIASLAQLYQEIKATDQAIVLLKRLLSQSAAVTPYTYRLLAALYQEQGETTQAIFWLEQLAQRFPTENTLPLFKAPDAGFRPSERVLSPRRSDP